MNSSVDARPRPATTYPRDLESALERIESRLRGDYAVSRRAIALWLLHGDEEIEGLVGRVEKEAGVAAEARELALAASGTPDGPVAYRVSVARIERAREVAARAVRSRPPARNGVAETISRLAMNPLTGIPLLAVVLYFGVYQFVGVFGAGTLVDWLESGFFGEIVNPAVTRFFEWAIPWPWLQDLFVHDYGIWTLGVTYAVALILPIVATFFLVFSVMEDTGYFPRLAMLIDRSFKLVGLSGRAVIPIVLGFGCDTMATMVTRILPTKRERLIATLLLSLAIPCTAQLGIILAILSGHPGALAIWAGMVVLTFVFTGFLASRVLPGTRASFAMEIPPLRLPRLANVLTKTASRMQWYLLEVLPLFLLASVLIWIGKLTGAFDAAVGALEPVVGLIGLPGEAAETFLFGFFRRDYGAAWLYGLEKGGKLDGVQLVVASVVLTLFIPCVAQFLVMKKERGWKTALGIAAFIIPFAFAVGFVLNLALRATGWTL